MKTTPTEVLLLKFRLLSWLPALLGMGVLFYTSSLPGNEIRLPPFPYSDKVVHAAAYAALGMLISLRKILRRRLSGDATTLPVQDLDFTGLAVGMLYGVSDEIHQLFVPLRSYDYGDMTADSLGVIVGYWIFARYFAPKSVPARIEAS